MFEVFTIIPNPSFFVVFLHQIDSLLNALTPLFILKHWINWMRNYIHSLSENTELQIHALRCHGGSLKTIALYQARFIEVEAYHSSIALLHCLSVINLKRASTPPRRALWLLTAPEIGKSYCTASCPDLQAISHKQLMWLPWAGTNINHEGFNGVETAILSSLSWASPLGSFHTLGEHITLH